MPLSSVLYTADGNTNQFDITFSYIDSTHVKVFVDNVEDNNFTFVNTSRIQTSSTPTNGQVVKIERQTPTGARLVDFQDGSVLTETDLDKSADQNFFIVQENADDIANKLGKDNTGVFDATNIRIKNLATPTQASDAATKAYIDTQTTSAATSATNSASSATASAASATSAASSASTATTKASEASTSATNAASSATTASTQASNASSSATAAASSATTATTKATEASNSATAAASSATTASGHASTATTKASEASTSATNAATSASTASTQATNAGNSATAAASSATSAASSFDSFDDRYLGAKSSNPSVDNDGDALVDGALYFDTTNNVLKVYDLGNTSWLTTKPSSSELTSIQSAVSNASNITTVAGISSDVTSVANIAGDVTSLANSLEKTFVVTVANVGGVNVFVLDGNNNPTIEIIRGNEYIFDVSDSSVSGHPLAFKDGSGNSWTSGVTVTGTAGNSGATVKFEVPSNAPNSMRYYCTSHGNAMGNTITVSDSAINTVSQNIASVNTNATNIASINSAASNATPITQVGGSIANVNTVASNLSGVNSFAERYRIASSAPTSSLDVGDLYFDTTANELKVYKSSGWAAAGSTVNGTSARFTYTISGTPTTVSGNDDAGNTLGYDAGFIDVYLNGVKQVNGTDVTVTSGNSVVFASALTNGDIVDIVGFGTFNVASMNANNLSSGTVPIARLGTSGTKDNTTFLRGDNTFAVVDTTNASNLSTGTLPNARLNAVPNSALANNSITINGSSVALGGSVTVEQDFSWETKTSNFNVSARRGYFVDTSSGVVTATLPASPSAGDDVRFIDSTGSFDTNNLTIARNGKKIQGDASDLTVATERAGLGLVFSGDTNGWLLIEK